MKGDFPGIFLLSISSYFYCGQKYTLYISTTFNLGNLILVNVQVYLKNTGALKFLGSLLKVKKVKLFPFIVHVLQSVINFLSICSVSYREKYWSL